MSWINKIEFSQAEGKLKKIYERIADENGYLDNIVKVHGQRPHTLDGHLSLYRNVMHHPANTFTAAWRETVAVYVSLLNQCDYCINHHLANLHRHVSKQTAETLFLALKANDLQDTFSDKQVVMLNYVKVLTLLPASVTKIQISRLLESGVKEGQILELNQLVGYFSYANRMALGLGLSNDGEQLGWVNQQVEKEVAQM
ncbi:MAG: peroxidase-related enzyme [Kangiellaceae bacterium]|nr:peroxidase-related enzyme [Kangiellaceae bacterium]